MAKFNLNMSDSIYAEVSEMADRLDISMADVVREALRLFSWITHEISADNRFMIQRGDRITELVVPELEKLRKPSSQNGYDVASTPRSRLNTPQEVPSQT